jgi:gas vesicle protein
MINLFICQILNYSFVFSKQIKPDIIKAIYNFQTNKLSSESEVNELFSKIQESLKKLNYYYDINDSRIVPLYMIEEGSEKKVVSGYVGYWTIEFKLKDENEVKKLKDYFKKNFQKLNISFELKGTEMSISDSLIIKEKLNYIKELLEQIKQQAKMINNSCSIEKLEFQDTQPTIDLPQVSQQRNSISFVVYITLNCNDKVQNGK